MLKSFVFLFMALFLVSCPQLPHHHEKDPFLWTEEIESSKALNWAKKQNQKTLLDLTSNKRFKKTEKDVLDIFQSEDRIPYIRLRKNRAFNFWRDKKSIRGILRATSLDDFMKNNPIWKTILDIDLLAKEEKENWAYKGINCLPPKFQNCFVSLSRGGKDARIIREYDLVNKKFVQDGFNLPETKGHITWIDQNHVLVKTNFGEGSLTDSGYPRIVKLWKRRTNLKKADLVFEGQKTDVTVSPYVLRHQEDQMVFITRRESFFTNLHWVYEGGKLHPVPIPKTANIVGLFNGYLILSLKKTWSIAGEMFSEGSLIALNKDVIKNRHIAKDQIQLIYTPNEKSTLWHVGIIKNRLLINVLENVRGRILQVSFSKGRFFRPKPMDLDPKFHWSLSSHHYDGLDFFVMRQDYLSPNILFLYRSANNTLLKIKSLPPRFENKSMVALQKWAKSKDGTMIPYSLIGKKSVIEKGNAPTLLHGYGGFQISLTPTYLGSTGKIWLEKGGLYVVANIRGGGEFGPNWHRSAQKKNRHKSYEDFIAVAEDLIRTGVTNKDKLAVKGTSNGGLLVGTVMTQKPDLFKGVVCQAPLLDMIRYPQLLAGASWMEEYGDPQTPEMKQYLLSYSPYHNIKRKETGANYPELFILTSTKDDRVHPGHARKMTAKMQELGHKNLYYYENIEGGHGMATNQQQAAKKKALIFEFLYRKLMDEPSTPEGTLRGLKR